MKDNGWATWVVGSPEDEEEDEQPRGCPDQWNKSDKMKPSDLLLLLLLFLCASIEVLARVKIKKIILPIGINTVVFLLKQEDSLSN